MGDKLFQIGEYIEEFNLATGQQLPLGPIYQSSGLINHFRTHHPNSDPKLLSCIPAVIQSPDYIGKHPKEPDSIELIKAINTNVMVCIKLDSKNGYLFVASVFEVSKSKITHRLNSRRLKKY